MARNRFDEDELEDRKIDVHIIARLFHWIKPYNKENHHFLITFHFVLLYSTPY